MAPNTNGASWGLWDNPADPSGADNIVAYAMHDAGAGIGDTTVALLQFVVTGAIPAGETLRVGVLLNGAASRRLAERAVETRAVRSCWRVL